jgi:hypothetical protein
VVSFRPPQLYPVTHWIGGWEDPRAGLDDVEKRKFLTLTGLELRPLCRPVSYDKDFSAGEAGNIASVMQVERCNEAQNTGSKPVLQRYQTSRVNEIARVIAARHREIVVPAVTRINLRWAVGPFVQRFRMI